MEERGGEALLQETESEEDGGSRRSVRGPAALHLPLLIASRGRRGRTWGGGRGINYAHSPHVSRLLRISASRNCRTEYAGGSGIQKIRAWAGARTWRAPSLRQRPVSRVGWQAFRLRGAPSTRGPARMPAGSRPPTPEDFGSGDVPDQGRLPAAGLSRWEAVRASRTLLRLEARSASGTTVGVSGHG